MTQYAHLLEPFDFGFIQLRNRMVMGAMHTRLEMLDRPVERLTEFFRVRARGEAGLILTGGFAPNPEGRMEEGAPVLDSRVHLDLHRSITDAVHAEGGKIALQILHAGRYAKHPLCVGPSAARAPINSFSPRVLSTEEVWSTIAAIAHTAGLAREAGYDGIELMGSEGYLLNEFTSAYTNLRSDEFGGSFEGRIKLPLEALKAIRARTGEQFLVIYRISAIDLVAGGMTGEESAALARRIEAGGANMLNTGIGWHESAIPTIAASVPRAAWRFAIENIKRAVSIPVIASNRINTPDAAEQLLAGGAADFVSMARPFLADPDFARKTREGRPDQINTCIGCNQACLDHIFTERTATCLVNPRAGRELEFHSYKAVATKSIAVVGGGAAGMAFAVNAAERGHRVTLFEAGLVLGGQLNLARVVPGKSEFDEMLRYFRARLSDLDVRVEPGRRITADELRKMNFDEVVIATGVLPRVPALEGIDHPKVASYQDVLSGRKTMGRRVAIIGAGGIGFDTAEFLLAGREESLSAEAFHRAWNVDTTLQASGGLAVVAPPIQPAAARQIYMLQRKHEKLGTSLGKSTGWILKAKLRRAGVVMIPGANYEKIDDNGLRYSCDGQSRLLEVDDVIICAGQESERGLYDDLTEAGMPAHVIGGADVAVELDALRAIEQATRLALSI
jgi:2,4-dienoyl-CoA reductase (NADPH2)